MGEKWRIRGFGFEEIASRRSINPKRPASKTSEIVASPERATIFVVLAMVNITIGVNTLYYQHKSAILSTIMIFRRFLVHPFLFALFPVLSLLALNRYQISPKEAILPGFVVLFIAFVLVLFFKIVLRDKRKAGLIVSLFFLTFF